MKTLPCVIAQRLAETCRTEAVVINVPMAVALVDAEGGLLSFSRMDGTLPVSTELAVSKAYTAAVLRMATHELGPLAQPGAALYGIQNGHDGKIVLFGGGYPLVTQGRVIGALGVSGGTVEEDMRVAQSAMKIFEKMEVASQKISTCIDAGSAGSLPMEVIEKTLKKEICDQFSDFIPLDVLEALVGGVILALA
ncbi:GlcG/HbpS family heme-binding protein [Telmatospirillum siberiense]|uniref:DNA polymerase III subunit delta n=1 Tax=Telmatospirillum siberiense TaxID=382514 RepID=A0A2N3PUK8_9PROT|nr:heme-binding protein [Telmatospirillum siberiense]PKU24083.1 DNA polymerase III subunit delta' [Telmatospirillum siberiense]